jgi:UDP-N-acetylmuramate dehydrogenase
VRCFDRTSQKLVEITNAGCRFAYRASIFNTSEKNRYVVLSVTYALTPGGAPKIVYKDLQKHFGEAKPDLSETRDAVLEIRAAKSMVIDERDPNSRSAGSFFKNPVVTKEKFAAIAAAANLRGIENVPSFPFDASRVKIPAAWLIEQSGFRKGFRIGHVGISTKHTLAIVNLGGATAADVLLLKDTIQAQVNELFEIELTPEPVFVGF